VVGFHSALAGLTADGQLAQHDDEAAEDCQDQVDDEEREAAGGAHLIGEAPDVAQAHSRADGSHEETKIGSKAFSFFHCFSLLNRFSSPNAGTYSCRSCLSTGNIPGHRHVPQVRPDG